MNDAINEEFENQYKKIMDEYYKCKREKKGYYEIKEIIMPLIDEFYNLYKNNSMVIKFKKFSGKWFDMCKEYLTDIPKEMEPRYEKIILNENEDDEKKILDYIVYSAREKLIGMGGEKNFIEERMLYNKCMNSQENINEICKNNNITNIPIDTDEKTFLQKFPHALNIIEIKGKKYIVDCTYRQFCGLASTNLNAVGTGMLPSPGAFLINGTETHKKMLQQLLRDGWIECTDENIKMYFDSFYLAHKNTDRKDYTMESSIPVEYYKKLINQGKEVPPIDMVEGLLEME